MNEYIFLNQLPLGKSARIVSLSGESECIQRLYDLGAVPNTEITYLMKSPLGDPRAYLLRGSVIALRCEDCNNISVFPIENTK